MLRDQTMPAKTELTGLQMLRGFCAVAVVVDHAAGMLSARKYGGHEVGFATLQYGFLGVDIFFVISAFIISLVVLRGPALTPALSAARFFEKRFSRIVPMMWIAILSYAALQAAFATRPIEPGGYVRALVLWPDSYLRPTVIWTLRQEFVFYAMFGLAFFAARPLRWLLALWVLSPLVYVASLGSWRATTGGIDSPASILFSTTNLEFGAGLVLGLAWVRHPPTRLWRAPVHPFVLLAGLTLASFAVCRGFALEGQTLATTATMGVLGAGIVAVSARVACPDDRLTRLGKALGDASYSIYLFHVHVLASVLAIMPRLPVALPGPLLLVATSLMAIAGGVAVSVLVERRVVRAAQAGFARWRARRAAQA